MNQLKKINFKNLSNFFPRQNEALELTKVFDYVLYGGTLGGGKSRWIRWTPLFWLLKWFEKGITGVRVGVFCEDYPSLNDRHLTYIKSEFPQWLGKYNEQRHEFTLDAEYGGGTIAFRNLDDADKYVSVEFALIAVDEINRNSFEKFSILRRRLRWPGIDRPKFIGACNPIGEVWVRDLWVDRIFSKDLAPLKSQFHFLESMPQDNPYLPQSYYDSLTTQDEKFVDAALKGNWHAYDTFMDKDGFINIVNANLVSSAQVDEPCHTDIKVLLIDPAAGGDESSIVLASETCREVLFSQPLEDTMSLVSLAVKFFDERDCIKGVIDGTGLGKPIGHRLKELGYDFAMIDFGEKADKEERFKNNKAELYWQEKEWLQKGVKLVKHDRWNEWNNIKYKISSDGIIELESKDRLRRRGVASPDVLDASVMFNALDIPAIRKRRNIERFGSPIFNDNIKNNIWKK